MDHHHRKQIERRLELLNLVERLGNVTEAARRLGISRWRYYEWRRRYDAEGREGLLDLPPIAQHHPATTPQDVVDRLVALSLEHPAWGRGQLARWLQESWGLEISASTVRRSLGRREMTTEHDRWLRLEREIQEGRIRGPSNEQRAFLERWNPAWCDDRPTGPPGALLIQDVYSLRLRLRYAEAQSLHVVLDPVSCYAFGMRGTALLTGDAVLLMRERVLPFYEDRGWRIKRIEERVTRPGRSQATRQYRAELDSLGIECISRPRDHPRHGLVRRFWKEIEEELKARMNALLKRSPGAADLRAAVDQVVGRYNGTPLEGYPNYGRSPQQIMESLTA